MVLRSPSFNPPLKPLANFDQTWQRWSLDGPLLELYPMTTHNHPRWLPWQKIENIDKIFPLKLLDQLGSNFGEAVLGWSPFRILSDNFADQPRWLPWRSIDNSAKNQFKNHLWNYWTNCDQHLADWFLDGPFQKCFWCPRLPTKKAVIFKSRKFGKKS